MNDFQLIQLLQVLLAHEDRYRAEAEFYTAQIQRNRVISAELLARYYTALIRYEEFDKIANEIYNILSIG